MTTAESLTKTFSIQWPFFAAQLVNLLVVLGLFFLAARIILKRGSGLEVPIWLFISFVIPVVMPIIALFYFRGGERQERG